jgi:hypothetical protein
MIQRRKSAEKKSSIIVGPNGSALSRARFTLLLTLRKSAAIIPRL